MARGTCKSPYRGEAGGPGWLSAVQRASPRGREAWAASCSSANPRGVCSGTPEFQVCHLQRQVTVREVDTVEAPVRCQVLCVLCGSLSPAPPSSALFLPWELAAFAHRGALASGWHLGEMGGAPGLRLWLPSAWVLPTPLWTPGLESPPGPGMGPAASRTARPLQTCRLILSSWRPSSARAPSPPTSELSGPRPRPQVVWGGARVTVEAGSAGVLRKRMPRSVLLCEISGPAR